MKPSPTKTDWVFYTLTLLIVIGGFLFWSSDLTSDPPMYYSGLGQSLATDPAQYVHHARNQVLYDDWDPFDYPRWTVYQHSLTSAVGWLVFSVWGVSGENAGVVGMVLSLGGLLFFLLGIFRHCRSWVTAAVALCFVINVTLLTYGRLSYLENGLILIAAIFFFVYCWFGHKLWGLVLSALLVAAATFTGKLFGALLLPALLLAVFWSGRPGRYRQMALTFCAYAVGSVLIVLLLYGGNFSAAFSYVGEQSYGLRGFPAGLSSPWGFFEHLIGYGFQNRMFYLDPDLFMFVLVAGLVMILFKRGDNEKPLSPLIRLSASWLGIVLLGLMPLNYSPLRYALFLIPAIIVLVFALIDGLVSKRQLTPTIPGKPDFVLLALLFWFALYHIVGNVFYFNNTPYRMLTWGCLPAAVLLVWAMRRALVKYDFKISRKVVVVSILLMIGLSGLANGFRIRRVHYLDHNFNLMEANAGISEIVGRNAVISGPYGPALTLNTKLKSFIHLFGVADVDSTLFDRQPITHLAVDVSNLTVAARDYPQLEGLQPVATYWIRDTEVKLFNISKNFNNPQAAQYEPSLYEQAQVYLQHNHLDSAQLELTRHHAEHPLTKSSGQLQIDIYMRTG
ncbi:MAG: hypothetical protein OEV80_13330, partial [candidate division Zixibacteria bacterium]|nr:hypothetical protein [candidate division Zixibacteria bacterium]